MRLVQRRQDERLHAPARSRCARGGLPDDVHVLFANTGKERIETLDFIHEIETRWSVRVRWLEWDVLRLDRTKPAEDCILTTWTETVREVNYETAARQGEPFSKLIAWKQYLPNPIQRLCTMHLKVEAMRLFCVDHLAFDKWDAIIGIRADEPRRHRIAGTDSRNPRETKILPLVEAGVSERDVLAFWDAQPFDLALEAYEGNCDLCFLKGRAKLAKIIRRRPDLVGWWDEQESAGYGRTANGSRFRADRPSYRRQLEMVQQSPMLFDLDDDTRPCACTD